MSDESAEKKPSERHGGNRATTDAPQEEFIAPESVPSASTTEAPPNDGEHGDESELAKERLKKEEAAD